MFFFTIYSLITVCYSSSSSSSSSISSSDELQTISSNPTFIPTINPTFIPTINPTFIPTINPTFIPTDNPTFIPTDNPTTTNPTNIPTFIPTDNPTTYPTNIPTISPVCLSSCPSSSPGDKTDCKNDGCCESDICICDETKNECDPDPCDNGGTCSMKSDCSSFECGCIGCFTGNICDESVNPCKPNQCESCTPSANGGQCTGVCNDDCPTHKCVCYSGFTGQKCDMTTSGAKKNEDIFDNNKFMDANHDYGKQYIIFDISVSTMIICIVLVICIGLLLFLCVNEYKKRYERHQTY